MNNYTNKDYQSILRELVNISGEVNKSYDPRPESENDPISFLLKNMALLGDMLSFYLDKQSLETHPATMTQRNIADDYYRLLGYYMEWYLPAKSVLTIRYRTNSSEGNKLLSKYSYISSPATPIKLYTIEDTVILNNDSTNINFYEGIYKKLDYGEVGVRGPIIKLNDVMVFIDSFTVKDIDDNELSRVSDIDRYNSSVNVYDIYISPNNVVQVRLSNEDIVIKSIEYLVSNGVGTSITSGIYQTNNPVYPATLYDNLSQKISYYNSDNDQLQVILSEASEFATKSPETPEEAYKNAKLIVNTYDALITPNDFYKAFMKSKYVNACVVTDNVTELNPPNNVSSNPTIYYRYVNDYSYDDANAIANYLSSVVSDYKSVNIVINHELYKDVFIHSWSPKGILTLTESLPEAEAVSLLNSIIDKLKRDYSPSYIGFGDPISLVELSNRIKSYDERILSVDLKPITYEISSPNVNATIVNYDEYTGYFYPDSDATQEVKFRKTISITKLDNIDKTKFYINKVNIIK